MIDIEIYRTEDGKEPFTEWISSVKDAAVEIIINARINRIRLGNFGDRKSAGFGVSELRIHYGPGYRVYYGRVGKKLVILLCAGAKGSQKKDIHKAQEYWKDYQRNN